MASGSTTGSSSSNEPSTSIRASTNSSTTGGSGNGNSIRRSSTGAAAGEDSNNVNVSNTSSSNSGNNPSDDVTLPLPTPSNNFTVTATPNVQKISNDTRLLFDSQRYATDHELIDVIFVFDGAKLGAHKFILLDGPAPVNAFYYEHLVGKKGVVVIDVPPGITFDSVDALLSYIYGKPFDQLDITEQNIEGFLKGAMYFEMDVQLLPELLAGFRAHVQDFVAFNFEDRLSTNAEFWNMDNKIILEICHLLRPELIEDAFLDWISSDKSTRKHHLIKLMDLRNLIAHGIEDMELFDGNDQGQTSTFANTIESDQTTVSVSASGESQEDDEVDVPNTSHSTQRRRTFKRKLDSGNDNDNSSSKQSSSFAPASKKKTPKTDVSIGGRTRGKPETTKEVGPSDQSEKLKFAVKRVASRNMPKGMDGFFKSVMDNIRENLAKRRSNKDFMDSWTTIWYYICNLVDGNFRRKNSERFLDGGGLELILESRKIFPDIANPDFNGLLLEILDILCQTFPSRVFRNDIVEHILHDLQNYDKPYDTTTAGDLLAYFLSNWKEDWDLEISHQLVSSKVREAIVQHWKLNVEIGTYVSNLEKFRTFSALIRKENDDPINLLCRLWFLIYYTSTDTDSPERNADGHKNLIWLQEANIKDRLEELANQTDQDISTYARELLNRLRKIRNIQKT